MIGLIQDFPVASLLTLTGFLIGEVFIPYTNAQYNFTITSQNPALLLFSYFSQILEVTIENFVLGIVLAALLGFVGFVIDFIRKSEYERL